MKIFRTLGLAIGIAIGCGALQADAHQVTTASLTIAHPYALPTPPGARAGGAYLTDIVNRGAEAETLLGATSPAAERVELHDMRLDGDVMRMRAVPSIEIAPGAHVAMAPGGGYHLMMTGLKRPWSVGDEIPVTLQFRHAGNVDVMLHVQERGATSMGAMHEAPKP